MAPSARKTVPATWKNSSATRKDSSATRKNSSATRKNSSAACTPDISPMRSVGTIEFRYRTPQECLKPGHSPHLQCGRRFCTRLPTLCIGLISGVPLAQRAKTTPNLNNIKRKASFTTRKNSSAAWKTVPAAWKTVPAGRTRPICIDSCLWISDAC